MCQQCIAEAIVLGSPLGDWAFVEATKDSESWKKGDFGLVEINDPTFYFTMTPRPDPSENDEDVGDAAFDWIEDAGKFGEELIARAGTGDLIAFHQLVEDGLREGYEGDGHFYGWLFDRLGKHLEIVNSVFVKMRILMAQNDFDRMTWDGACSFYTKDGALQLPESPVVTWLNESFEGFSKFELTYEELTNLAAVRHKIFPLAENNPILWIDDHETESELH